MYEDGKFNLERIAIKISEKSYEIFNNAGNAVLNMWLSCKYFSKGLLAKDKGTKNKIKI